MGPMLSAVLAFVVIVSAGESFTCTSVKVWDGDGPIWCAEGPRVRLHGINAQEIGGGCNRGHPCPKAGPLAARDALVDLLGPDSITKEVTGHIVLKGAAPLQCLSHGHAKGKRTAASCESASGLDLSCQMIRLGAAAEWPKFSHGVYAGCGE